jgi:heavy metal efflux system protein
MDEGMTKDKMTRKSRRSSPSSCPASSSTFPNTSKTTSRRRSQGSNRPIQSRSSGPNLETLTKLAQHPGPEMNQVKGICDLGIFPVFGQPNLNIKVDREKVGALRPQCRGRQHGRSDGHGWAVPPTVLEGDREWNLVVRYAPNTGTTFKRFATSRWAIRRPAASTPTSR